jgi:hypothetical protein
MLGGGAGAAARVLALQRRLGNHYVQRMLALARSGEREAAVTPELEESINRKRGGGQALDSSARTSMESAFGTDFSAVRVHTDGEADHLNRAVNAVAFTVGSDIFFSQGSYNTGSGAGRELLAHELTHVVQQDGGPVQTKLTVGAPDDVYEQQAERTAKEVTATLDQGRGISAAPSGSISRTCSCGGASDANESEARTVSVSDEVNVEEEDGVQDESKLRPSITPAMRTIRRQIGSSDPASGVIQRTPSVSAWTFTASGSTSANNCCALCPMTLGVGGPSSFTNGMELEAFIADDETGAAYDVKRVKERSTWQRVGGAWNNLTHVGPGADDDSHNDDECLTTSVTIPFLPAVYSIDSPGFTTTGFDPAATDAVYKASFVESVRITPAAGGAFNDTKTFAWHTISWLTQTGGTWAMDVARSEIAPGSVAVGTGAP